MQPYGHFNGSIEAGEEMDKSIAKLAKLLESNKQSSCGPSSQNTYVLANALRLSKQKKMSSCL